MRSAISESKHSQNDPLLGSAKDQDSVYYDVTFETKQPLGLVLERSADWALVKIANSDSTHVTVGSALTTVNDKNVTLLPYNKTIKLLTAWKPPLKLGFRLAPEKKGFVTKQGRGRKTKRKNWKPRFFVLTEGRLSYYSSDGPDAKLKGVVHLMGSAVSLIPRAETGQYFCFKIVSGITGIIMQGLTVEDMMDWATTIYHAIAVANGGGFLLDVERDLAAARMKEEKIVAEKMAEVAELKKRREQADEANRLAELAKEEEEKAREIRESAKGAEEVEKAKELEKRAATSARLALAKQMSSMAEVTDVEQNIEGLDSELAELELEEDGSGGGNGNGKNGEDEDEDEEEDEPTDWQAYWNVTHCVWYYYHLPTQTTSWERPEGVEITVNQPEVWEAEMETEDIDRGGRMKPSMSVALNEEMGGNGSEADRAASMEILQASGSVSFVSGENTNSVGGEISVVVAVVEEEEVKEEVAKDVVEQVHTEEDIELPTPPTTTTKTRTESEPVIEDTLSGLVTNFHPPPLHSEHSTLAVTDQINREMGEKQTSGMIRPEATEFLQKALDRNKSISSEEPPQRSGSRRRSTVPIVMPPITLPPTVQEDDDDDDDDELSEVAVTLTTAKLTQTATNPENDEDSEEDPVEDEVATVLTADELTAIFRTVDHGAKKGQLNPMLFGTLIRAVTNNSLQLLEEMQLFQWFNTSGDGVIDLEEWLEGVEKKKVADKKFYKVSERMERIWKPISLPSPLLQMANPLLTNPLNSFGSAQGLIDYHTRQAFAL